MRKSFYRRAVLFLVCLVTVMHIDVVHAGEINANEARLVDAASGIFTYEGKQYRASAQYVSDLRSHLSQDDVDLAAEDVASLISDMYANVEAGVRDGRLEEIKDVPEAEDETSEDAEKDTSDEKPDEADTKENAEPDETGATENAESDETGATENAEPDEAGIKKQNTDHTEKAEAEDEIKFTAKFMIKNVGYHTQCARGIRILGILALAPIGGGIYLVSKHEKV